ncbi:MAG: MlaD family protein [Methylococcales bacterium]|nr:MCE family protein [Methylococcaceae bacterium]
MGRNTHAVTTGLFLIALVTVSVAVIYWLGHFDRERNHYVIYTRESVSGLNPESTVFFRGIAVGKVLKVEFDPNDSGTILVPIEVDKNIILSRSVYATLRLKGVTGLTQIQLEDNDKVREPIHPGDIPDQRIPLLPSLTDRLMNSGEEILHKADRLMIALGSVLSDNNINNIGGILDNIKGLTDKLAELQKSVDAAMVGIPSLTQDARGTLKNINKLTADLQTLTHEVKTLSSKTSQLADTGQAAGNYALQTTLPKINDLLIELNATSQQVKRVAASLENNPQGLLLGPAKYDAGPGEPGYEESR